MKKEEEKAGFFGALILACIIAIFLIWLIYSIFDYEYGWNCKIKTLGDDDLYCAKYSRSNLTSSGYEWTVRSHSVDQETKAQWELAREQERIEEEKRMLCYNAGSDINESYDILIDYNYTCDQLEYINDHFVDNVETLNGGYIKGSSYGLFSGGYIKGEIYNHIVTSISATGQLTESYKSHVDCTGKHHNIEIDTYEESEFVMYYVDKCIGGSA